MTIRAFLGRPAASRGRQLAERRFKQGVAQQIETIREKAYQIYLSRAGAPGSSVVDWLEAESAVRGAASPR